jgi:arylsulfatase B
MPGLRSKETSMRRATTCALLSVLSLFSISSAWAKNYLVIIMDDLSVDKVSSYAGDYPGYAPTYLPDTHTIDSIADAGVRFTRAWATPLCSPTRASFQTGQHPFRHGVGTALGETAPGLATANPLMIAKSFGSRGYATGMFGKYHIGTRNANGGVGVPRDAMGNLLAMFSVQPHPSLTGWDRFLGSYGGYPGPDAGDPDDGYFKWIRVDWAKGLGHALYDRVHATDRAESAAVGWINAQTRPWLAVVAFNAAHSGTTASTLWKYDDADPGQFRTPALACLATEDCTHRTRQVYQGLVEHMDLKIQALLDGIDDSKLDDTVIVLFGDNGTPGQNNSTATAVQESLFNVAGRGKGTLFENGIRVPLIVADGKTWRTGIAGPTVVAPGRTVDARVHTLDIYNTLYGDAFAVSLANLDSMPFTDCLKVNHVFCGFPEMRYGYSETFPSNTSPIGARAAVSYGHDKMIAIYNNAVGKKCLEQTFYDTSADPFETAPQAWVGVRADRLRDRFTALHTPVTSWAHLAGDPVVAFCP